MSVRTRFGRVRQTLGSSIERFERVFDSERNQDNLAAFLFVLPNLVVFSVFLFGPVLFAFYLSFTDWNVLTADPNWVGLDNYVGILTPAPWADGWAVLDTPTTNLWWHAVKQTATYTIGTVPLAISGGLCAALLLDRDIRQKQLFRAAYFMPVMLSGAVSAIIWRWILNQDGIVNTVLEPIGLAHNWGGDPSTALFAVMLIAVWGGIGFNMIIFLAGLQNIPEELYDAARIDGTNGWQRFRHVTWPNLQNTYFFVIVLSIISSFQVFAIAMTFAEGGPYYATTTIAMLIYQEAFEHGQMGEAAAMAFVLFSIIFAFSYYQYTVRGNEEVNY
ncbi:carbohydrate ABC transporter permease [Natrarchaeobius sp. A-rgal3]|uniref:carbohydrate ABC transporter permease n=1 Tax=Natrarchaeobius versutus TaxID=1679078 RepID=UPI00350EA2CA